jgi:hypothetical protein
MNTTATAGDVSAAVASSPVPSARCLPRAACFDSTGGQCLRHQRLRVGIGHAVAASPVPSFDAALEERPPVAADGPATMGWVTPRRCTTPPTLLQWAQLDKKLRDALLQWAV